MKKFLFTQKGFGQYLTKEQARNSFVGLFDWTRWFKKQLDDFNISYYDSCCDSSNTTKPIRFNETTGETEFFNGTIWTPLASSTSRKGVSKTTDATLTVDETGNIFGNKTTALTLTLPATVVGYNYKIINVNGEAVINVSPNSSDYIGGAGLTKVVNKDLIIPAVKGAFVQIQADGVDGWYIMDGSIGLTKEV